MGECHFVIFQALWRRLSSKKKIEDKLGFRRVKTAILKDRGVRCQLNYYGSIYKSMKRGCIAGVVKLEERVETCSSFGS